MDESDSTCGLVFRETSDLTPLIVIVFRPCHVCGALGVWYMLESVQFGASHGSALPTKLTEQHRGGSSVIIHTGSRHWPMALILGASVKDGLPGTVSPADGLVPRLIS